MNAEIIEPDEDDSSNPKSRLKDLSKLEIIDLRGVQDESLLEAFYRDLYLPAFPIVSERENPGIWKPLLWGKGSMDPRFRLHALIAGTQLRDPSKRRIYGGHLFEFHRRSCCGLLTYLVVSPEARGQGLARLLLDLGIQELKKTAETQGLKLRAIFGEINDPNKVTLAEDTIDPWIRLAIFQHLGARVIDIPYVQPQLGDGNIRSRCLMLVTFVDSESAIGSFPRSVVYDFLKDFYESLGINQPEIDRDFVSMLSAVTGENVPLVTMRQEEPTITVSRYGVAFHFVAYRQPEHHERNSNRKTALRNLFSIRTSPPSVTREVASELKQAREFEQEIPNVFESFEQDILAYNFQQAPPFRSVPIGPVGGKLIDIIFPDYMDFKSEGGNWRLCGVDKDHRRIRKIRVIPSKTLYKSGIIVYHFVVTSEDNSNASILNEYDLIKLIKLYAISEDVDPNRLMLFSVEGKKLTWSQLLVTVFEDIKLNVTDLRAVTIQLLVGENDDSRAWQTLFESCALLLNDRTKGTLEVDSHVKSNDEAGMKLKALVGIVSGILDFDNIEAWELADVLKPVMASGREVTSFQKGILFNVAPIDRAFQLPDCRSQIGISPYLVLPHATLLHNEEIIRRVENIFPNKDEQDIHRLEYARANAEWDLKENLLPNVFHYWYERTLFDSGLIDRGLQLAMTKVERRLDELIGRIEAVTRHRQRNADLILQIGIFILTAVLALIAFLSWRAGKP